jgi:hypothetical protein
MFITVLFTRDLTCRVHHRRASGGRVTGERIKKSGQTTALPQVAFVDLVDSDDDNGGDVEELDLELKL